MNIYPAIFCLTIIFMEVEHTFLENYLQLFHNPINYLKDCKKPCDLHYTSTLSTYNSQGVALFFTIFMFFIFFKNGNCFKAKYSLFWGIMVPYWFWFSWSIIIKSKIASQLSIAKCFNTVRVVISTDYRCIIWNCTDFWKKMENAKGTYNLWKNLCSHI